MNEPQQSVAWWSFVPRHLSPQAFVRTVAELGYRGVDLVPSEYWSLVTQHGLRISAIAGHQSITHGLNHHDQHDRIEQEIRANLALAERWGIPNLICFSGNRNQLDDRRGVEATAAGLQRVARAAEDAGVTLVLELLNSKVDHPDYHADHTAWGVQVCNLVKSPRVKLLYDIYHMQIMEGDIIRTIQAAAEVIGHYHTAGNPGRHEPDDTQELNYPAIVRAIQMTGYTGYIGHEFIPSRDPITVLRATFELCARSL
jgi:hydroxypyruvate isomerase